MANKIQVRRGLQTNLPTLDEGEFGFVTDTERLYIGNPLGSGNILMSIGGPGFDLGNGADGYVTFFTGPNALAGDNDFFWDRENNRLGLRTDQPTHTLTVDGYITPATDNFHRLGTPDQRWEAIHLGPDSLHISSAAIETGISFDWRITIDQTTGNEGKLLIVQGEEQFVSVDPVASEIIFTVGEVTAEGNIKLAQISAPIDESGYGKLYVSSADSQLHFIDESGSDTNILSDFASQTIEDQRWTDSSEQRQDIRDALDGYGSDSSELDNQRWVDSSQQRQDLRDACDGYASSTTEDQRWVDSSQQRQDLRDACDGYASSTTEDQRWVDSSEQRQNIRSALDGYSAGSGNVSATEGADGYISFFTGEQTIAGDNDLYWDRAHNRLGIGTSSLPIEKLTVNGVIALQEQTASAATENGYGKVYVKDDDKLYYRAGGGTEYDLTSTGENSSGVSGAVQFSDGANGFSSDDSNFHWDNGNNRLGIGTNSPAHELGVAGNITIGSTFASAGTGNTDGLNIEGNLCIGLNSSQSDDFYLRRSNSNIDYTVSSNTTNNSHRIKMEYAIGDSSVGGYTSLQRVLYSPGSTSSLSTDLGTIDLNGAIYCRTNHASGYPSGPFIQNSGNGKFIFMSKTQVGMTLSTQQHLGIKTLYPHEALTVAGILSLAEQDNYDRTHDGYGSLWAKSDGKAYYTNDDGTEYDLTAGASDERLKNTIETIENALDKTTSMRGVTFEWNEDKKGKGTQLGLIAQEVEQVVPDLVWEDKLGYKNIKHHQLTGLFVEAIKELKRENEELKSRLLALEKRINI